MVNEQGALGEVIFDVAISRGYLFRSRALGGKWPVSDFYVESINLGQHYHFFVQVKSTLQGSDKQGNLKVYVDREKGTKLSQYHAPTYVAGVDIRTEQVFLFPLNKPLSSSMKSIPTTFELTEENLYILSEEVKIFWENSGVSTYKDKFNYNL